MAKDTVTKDMAKKYFQSSSIRLSSLGLSVGLACLLSITGCDDKDTKDPKSGKDVTSETNSGGLEAVKPNVNEVCGNANLATGLSNYLVNNVRQQTKTFAAAHAQSSNVQLDLEKVGTEAENISIDVSNLQAVKGAQPLTNGMVSCQANVAMSLPAEVVSRANAMYNNGGQGDLEQVLANTNVKLDGNALTADAFSFMVDPQSSNIQTTGQPALLKATSEVLAQSSIKSQIDAQEAARRAAARKKAQREAAARRKAQQLAAKRKAQREAAARKKALAEQQRALQEAEGQSANLSLETDGVPFDKATTPTAPAKNQSANKPLAVKGAENIEVVIVEEQGTY